MLEGLGLRLLEKVRTSLTKEGRKPRAPKVGEHRAAASVTDHGECRAKRKRKGWDFLGDISNPAFVSICPLSILGRLRHTLLSDELCIRRHVVPFTILITEAL